MEYKIKELAAHCARYSTPSSKRASLQITTTSILFVACYTLMYLSLDIHYALTVLLSIPTAGLVLRLFVMQHDCGHGSFYSSKRANNITGRLLSVITLTPYAYWRRAHALHHTFSSNLDQRGVGDINTLTIEEYQALGLMQQIAYRIYRHPFFLLFVGGPVHFLIFQRVPFTLKRPVWEMWSSVFLLDLVMIIVYGALIYVLGWTTFLQLFVPVFVISTSIGVWLFFIQHQFEDAHWAKEDQWNRQNAALIGSSYYVLPRVLEWFTGSIGLHHIHHLCSRIPNYRLRECLEAEPELKTINRITFTDSLKCAHLTLWDEKSQKLVSFSEI